MILAVKKFSVFKDWNIDMIMFSRELHSSYPSVKLEKIIVPRKTRVKPSNVPTVRMIVSKIRFSDGEVAFKDRKLKNDMNISCLNDLLVSNINFEKGAFAVNTWGDIYASTDYTSYVVDTNLVLPKYLFLALRCDMFIKYVASVKPKGMKTRARYEFIKNFEIPVPPLAEQSRLVNEYLSRLEEASKLSKLQELNFSSYFDKHLGIFEVVSQSNLFNLMRFKNIDKWGIDQILKNKTEYNHKFCVRKLMQVCDISSGGTPSRAVKKYYQGNIPWVKTGEVVNDYISDTEEHITEQAIESSSTRIYPKDSLIIAMYGQGLTRGRTAKLKIDACTNQACAVLTNINNSLVLTDYVWAYLMNEYDRLRALASGNNQPNLNLDMIKNYPIVIPDLTTQQKIIEEVILLRRQANSLKQEIKQIKEQATSCFENAIFS